MRLPVVISLALSILAIPAFAASEPQYGLSIFGDLALDEDLQHFPYVDPDAPRGGTLRVYGIGTYDTLNPFTIKGRAPRTDNAPFSIETVLYMPLMERNYNEPDSYYPGIARAVSVDPDRMWARFYIDPRATFQDGSPITPEDVAFSLTALQSPDANPIYRQLFQDITGVETDTAANSVTFQFDPNLPKASRNRLPITVAGNLPVLSKAWFEANPLNESNRKPPIGSGPYRAVASTDTNRLVLERVTDHWAYALPSWQGRWNFDTIELDYYLDMTAAFEAFGKGEYDIREEYSSRIWATGYTFPAVEDGKIVRLELPDERMAGLQAWFINTRREKFQDPRVREAIGLAFDFEWSNKNLFYGLYERTTSIFQGGDIAAKGPPSAAEIALLEPFRDQLPSQVFTEAYVPPVTDGSGRLRAQLRQAAKMLDAAGWSIQDGTRRNAAGDALELEFLISSPLFERILNPFIDNLKTIGVVATIRRLDSSAYQNRIESLDFDVVGARFATTGTPGLSLKTLWGSEGANTPGTRNYSGLAHPAVDALIDTLVAAESRAELAVAASALDRVIMWQHNLVTQWTKGIHTLAVWDIFGRPEQKPTYNLGDIDTWWIDPVKADALAAERR